MAQPGLVCRHHVCADAARISVPGRGAGLVQSLRAGVGAVQHAGGAVLRGGLRPGAGERPARDLQHGPGVCSLRATSSRSGWRRWGSASVWMAGGAALDNIFVERLWRSVKYEEIYLRDYADGVEAWRGLQGILRFTTPSDDTRAWTDGPRPRSISDEKGGTLPYGLAGDRPV